MVNFVDSLKFYFSPLETTLTVVVTDTLTSAMLGGT